MSTTQIYTSELDNRLTRIQQLGSEVRQAIADRDADQIWRLAGELASLAEMAQWSAEKAGMRQAMQIMVSQGSDEWYTPAWVIALAREILGGIDLDPASCEVAQRTVQAARFYQKTETEDGYMRPWSGRVWLNPPFTEAERWFRRLAAAYTDGEVSAAILLINSAPGYHWYEALIDAWPAVQLRERLVFCGADGQPFRDAHGRLSKAKKSQTLVYFGSDVARFEQALAPYGRRLHGTGAALVAPLWEVSRDAA